MSSALNFTDPAVGRSRHMISFARVDFPHPDSPTTPRVSPRCRSKETPSTACTAPMLLRNTIPCVNGKYLTRSRTSRTASLDGAIEHLLPEVACAATVRRHDVQGRHFLSTDVLRVGAPGIERAAWRDPHQVGRQPLDGVQLLTLHVHARN